MEEEEEEEEEAEDENDNADDDDDDDDDDGCFRYVVSFSGVVIAYLRLFYAVSYAT